MLYFQIGTEFAIVKAQTLGVTLRSIEVQQCIVPNHRFILIVARLGGFS